MIYINLITSTTSSSNYFTNHTISRRIYISTFFISKSLSDGRIKLIGDIIESQIAMHNVAAYNVGSALSFVLMMMILVSLFIANKFGDEDGGVMV